VRLTRGVDIRTVGSGNIGATNVWRSFGPRYAIPVIVLDVAKGFVPVLVATLVAGHVAGALTGGAAMLGHWRPIFLRFAKGGKMVATCGGALFGLAPLVGLAAHRGPAPRRAVASARLRERGGAGSALAAPREPLAAARRNGDARPTSPQAGDHDLVTACY
jgi:Glycerol-3-phosphate acyltransferase